jgi:hypothetical protein
MTVNRLIHANKNIVYVNTAVDSNAIVFLSNASYFGQTITIKDSAGKAGPTNIIRITTCNDVSYLDPTLSNLTIQQPFGYLTFTASSTEQWSLANSFAFEPGFASSLLDTPNLATILYKDTSVNGRVSIMSVNNGNLFLNGSNIQDDTPAVEITITDPFIANTINASNITINNSNPITTSNILTSNALFLATGGSFSTYNNIQTSLYDGSVYGSWSNTNGNFANGFGSKLLYVNSNFVALGGIESVTFGIPNTYNYFWRVMTSANAIDWTTRHEENFQSNSEIPIFDNVTLDIKYGNGYYVVLAGIRSDSNSRVYYSSNLTNWTQETTPTFSPYPLSFCTSLEYGEEDNIFLIAESKTSNTVTSNLTTTSNYIPSQLYNKTVVAYLNGYIGLFINDTSILTSFIPGGGVTRNFYNNGNIIVGVGGPNVLGYSLNGSNWYSASTNPFASSGSPTITSVAYGNGYWAATAFNSLDLKNLIYSTDGSNWTKNNYNFNYNLTSIAYNSNDNYWIVGSMTSETGDANPLNTLYKISNITTTSFVPANSGGFGMRTTFVQWGSSNWVAVGCSSNTSLYNEVLYSSDGLNWSKASNTSVGGNLFFEGGPYFSSGSTRNFGYYGNGIAYGNNNWLICGGGWSQNNFIYSGYGAAFLTKLYRSQDGINFSNITGNITPVINDITSSTNYQIYDLKYYAASNSFYMTIIQSPSSSSQYLLKSTNNGNSWTIIHNNTGTFMSRIAVGVGSSNILVTSNTVTYSNSITTSSVIYVYDPSGLYDGDPDNTVPHPNILEINNELIINKIKYLKYNNSYFVNGILGPNQVTYLLATVYGDPTGSEQTIDDGIFSIDTSFTTYDIYINQQTPEETGLPAYLYVGSNSISNSPVIYYTYDPNKNTQTTFNSFCNITGVNNIYSVTQYKGSLYLGTDGGNLGDGDLIILNSNTFVTSFIQLKRVTNLNPSYSYVIIDNFSSTDKTIYSQDKNIFNNSGTLTTTFLTLSNTSNVTNTRISSSNNILYRNNYAINPVGAHVEFRDPLSNFSTYPLYIGSLTNFNSGWWDKTSDKNVSAFIVEPGYYLRAYSDPNYTQNLICSVSNTTEYPIYSNVYNITKAFSNASYILTSFS